jgi:repressor LexA
LEVLKLPDSATPAAPSRGRAAFKPSVVSQTRAADGAATAAGPDIPILGKIAAGVPRQAIESEVGRITAPADLLASGDHFALEVKGDSMINAGILDGDIVILKRTNAADNGDIVVALVDGEEATLKRIRKRGQSIALEAANPAFETRIFGPDRVEVQGRLVALIRRYA